MFNSDFNLQEMTTVVVMLAAALAACGQPADPAMAETESPIASSAVAGPMSDAAIASRVSLLLQADGQLKASNVAVASQGGRVTLTGTLPDTGALQRAGYLAGGVPGVRSVFNRVVVNGHG